MRVHLRARRVTCVFYSSLTFYSLFARNRRSRGRFSHSNHTYTLMLENNPMVANVFNGPYFSL